MATSYSTLDTTIRRALLGEGDENKNRYVQAFMQARRWYESEYTGGVERAYGHKTERLEVNPDRSVSLPDDYIEWSMVGIRRGEQLYNLLANPRLVAIPGLRDEPGGDYPYPALDAPEYAYTYRGQGDTGLDYLRGWGYPSLRLGEFSIDRATRTLLVSSAISPGEVLYLEYLSDDAPCCDSTLIHPLAEPWLEFYILHYLHKKKNPALAADYRRDAEQARSNYIGQRSAVQLDDFYAAMRNTLAQPV